MEKKLDMMCESFNKKFDSLSDQIKNMDVKLKKLDQLEKVIEQSNTNTEKIHALEFEIEELKEIISKQDAEHFKIVSILKENQGNLENYQRRNNIVIVGIEEKENENWTETENLVIDFLKQKLNVEVQIERAHRLGTRSDKYKSRPIIVLLSSFKYKARIFQNIRMLKGSGCYINEDFSLKTREERAKLIRYAKVTYPKEKFRLQVNRLTIKGKTFEVGHVGVFEVT